MLLHSHLRVRDPHNNGDLAPWVPRSTAPPLSAVDDKPRPLSADRAGDVGCIAGRHLWFCHAETRSYLSIQQGLEPFLLLFLTAIEVKDLHIA